MKLTPIRRPPLSQEPASGMAWPRLRDRMDRLFQSVFADPWREFAYPGTEAGWTPDVDVKETDKAIEIVAEIPGMDPAQIQINAQGDLLTISGEKREEVKEEKGDYTFSEIHYGAFQRAIQLPESADADRISADYDKGMLRISIPKKEGAAPRRIEVKAAGDGGKQGGPKA
jgi:HSP20 family protein